MLGARRARYFGLFLLVLAAVAGCGGNGYTRTDFIARADAICAGALRQTRSIPPPAAQAGSVQDDALAAYLSGVVPVLESEASQLEHLRRPPGSADERATLQRWYAALAQSVTHYKELAAAARRGDDQSVSNAEAALGASQVYSLAAAYGLHSCGTPGATTA